MEKTAQISLSDELTIWNVEDLYAKLLDALANNHPVEVDVHAAERIDVAGLQLLVVAHQDFHRHQVPLRIIGGPALASVADRCAIEEFWETSAHG